MEFNQSEVIEILKTLPIGYYAGRDIPIEFSPTEDTSFYDMKKDKITFSLNNIMMALKNSESLELETAVRTILYHETAHAVLTPSVMKLTDINNVFEDERIETLLENYFHNVNFKETVRSICDYKGEKPTTPFEAFYHLVRFRQGRKELLKEVEQIITDFSGLNRHNTDTWTVRQYENSILNLYRQFERDYQNNSNAYNEWNIDENGELQDCSTPFSGGGCSLGKYLDEDIKEIADEIKQAKEQANEQANNQNSEEGKEEEEKNRQGIPKGFGEKIFKIGTKGYTNTVLIEKIERIFETFNKKNNSGSATTCYSGVINPRLCGNNDYKFFERKTAGHSQNKFGSMHLNLFIDVSGSFCDNAQVVNELLRALEVIAKKNHNFTFDVVHCGCGQQLKSGSDIYIDPDGGNRLTFDILEIYKKLQKPNTSNYNIILFDGWACPEGEHKHTPFKALDFSNCTFISDDDNECELKYNQRSRQIYTEDYAKELYKNVFETLQIAFR